VYKLKGVRTIYLCDIHVFFYKHLRNIKAQNIWQAWVFVKQRTKSWLLIKWTFLRLI